MATGLSDAAVEAANLALKMGSAAVGVVSFMAELGEELPYIGPVLNTLTAIREKVETVENNGQELKALEERCTYITACVIVKCRQNPSPSSGLDVTPLKDCVEAAGKFAERCSRRRKLWRVLKASSDKDEIAGLNARVDRLTGDVGLAGIATVLGEVTDLNETLEQMVQNQAAGQTALLANQEAMIDRLDNLSKPPIRMADVPQGTPTPKGWHVERHHVMETVFEALIGKGGPCLVGLVGLSGSGKTTAASEIVRSTKAREAFPDGIVWLTVNDGAKRHLPSLMLQLAHMVYKDVGGSVGNQPMESDDSCAYVRHRMENGHRGKGFKCLVVADNVWEQEVVSKLLQTGMSVLLTTRDDELVTGTQGVAVQVDKLSEADAESVLRKAAELSEGARLPDDAVDLIELCGRMAMDLAFVGRWSIVRGRQDRTAWSDATRKVRAEIAKGDGDPQNDTALDTRAKRRKAILRAGFEDLAVGSDDERVPRLYLSLAVMPDGYGFSVKDAAVLLYDRVPGVEDEASVRVVVDILERWSVLRSTRRAYHMHDAHSAFSRESLMDRGDVRRPALERWVGHISSLDALRSLHRSDLKGLWLGVELVGGDSWDISRPYEAALAEMDDSDPLFRKSANAVGRFQETQEDWEKASTTWRRLLKVGKASITWRQLLEVGLEHSASAPHEDAVEEVADLIIPGLTHLIICARKKNATEEETEWRNEFFKSYPYWVNVDGFLDDGDLASGFREGCMGYIKTIPSDGDVETFLRECLVIYMAKLGPEHVRVANVLHELGANIQRAGRLEEAEELLRRIGMKEANVGLEGVSVAKTQRELGVCLRKAGRLDDAEEIMRCALNTQEKELGPKKKEMGFTLHELGVCMRECERLDEAEDMLRRSLKIMKDDGGVGLRGWMADTLYELSICVREAGWRAEEADDILTRSKKAKEEYEEATQKRLASLWFDETTTLYDTIVDECVIS